ncbi:hypothetical protein [Streptomyces alanosinicus]|uniref:DUF1772 domain-containing protein n=1 Tax=Streptomyces alanosinicus TaxID=68171 RepID=A0A918YDJ6_9ACTN|nr:hypothetical protein GCM10010339_11770 [Streptomyces alanosinicus]
MAFSIPLNNALAAKGAPAALRDHFEGPWVAWNTVRAVGSTLALGLLARALLLYGRLDRSPQSAQSARSAQSEQSAQSSRSSRSA